MWSELRHWFYDGSAMSIVSLAAGVLSIFIASFSTYAAWSAARRSHKHDRFVKQFEEETSTWLVEVKRDYAKTLPMESTEVDGRSRTTSGTSGSHQSAS
jgi:hypothetical protein